MRALHVLPLTALVLASAVLAQRTPVRSPALILSEFGASNGGVLFDEDGATSDWIELHNRRNATFEAGGWTLTDDAGLTRVFEVAKRFTFDVHSEGPDGWDTLDLNTLGPQAGEGGGEGIP